MTLPSSKTLHLLTKTKTLEYVIYCLPMFSYCTVTRIHCTVKSSLLQQLHYAFIAQQLTAAGYRVTVLFL